MRTWETKPSATGDNVVSGGAVFVGFDSAWADNATSPGAICSVGFDGAAFIEFREPILVSFDGALAHIRAVHRANVPTVVALDQPTIVTNATGMRPAEKVAASLISWMGGGVQPANAGRPFFGPTAPVGRFLRQLGASEDPEIARSATSGVHLIEVFPALALASLEPKFFGLRKGPRYNPARRNTFRIEHWVAVCDAAVREARFLGCGEVVAWLDECRSNVAPKKADQDRLDAVLCLLIAARWRLEARERSVAIGDLESGYIIAPVSNTVLLRLREAAKQRGVPIDSLGEPTSETNGLPD